MSTHPAGATAASDPATPSTAGTAGNELHRGLTGRQISMIGLSGALGTGLFLGSGRMIALAGPGIIASYALTGLVGLVIIWALAEMVVKHPVEGGFGTVAQAYLGPLGGWVARWNTGVVMALAVGAEVVASATYLTYWWPQIDVRIATVGFSILLVLINLATVKLYGASEYWFSIIKVTMVVVFIALGLVMIFLGLPGRPAAGLDNLTRHGGFAPFGVSGILVGAVMAIFSFGGAENVSLTAAESEDPGRDIPRAAKAMILRLVLFYVGAIAIVVALQPWTVSAAGSGTVTGSPFVTVLSAAKIPAAAGIMNFILITAAMSSGNGCLYASARMIHALAQDGHAPRAIARTTPGGAPRNAVLLATAGMATASVMSFASPEKVFAQLMNILTFGLWLTWVIILVTYLAYRLRRNRLGLPQSQVQLRGNVVSAGIALLALVAAGVGMAVIPDLRSAWETGLPYLVVLGVAFVVVRMVTKDRPQRATVLEEELAGRREA